MSGLERLGSKGCSAECHRGHDSSWRLAKNPAGYFILLTVFNHFRTILKILIKKFSWLNPKKWSIRMWMSSRWWRICRSIPTLNCSRTPLFVPKPILTGNINYSINSYYNLVLKKGKFNLRNSIIRFHHLNFYFSVLFFCSSSLYNLLYSSLYTRMVCRVQSISMNKSMYNHSPAPPRYHFVWKSLLSIAFQKSFHQHVLIAAECKLASSSSIITIKPQRRCTHGFKATKQNKQKNPKQNRRNEILDVTLKSFSSSYFNHRNGLPLNTCRDHLNNDRSDHSFIDCMLAYGVAGR